MQFYTFTENIWWLEKQWLFLAVYESWLIFNTVFLWWNQHYFSLHRLFTCQSEQTFHQMIASLFISLLVEIIHCRAIRWENILKNNCLQLRVIEYITPLPALSSQSYIKLQFHSNQHFKFFIPCPVFGMS